MRQALIISNPEDEHTRVVTAKIAALGVEPVLFFPEHLGERLRLSLALETEPGIPPELALIEDSLSRLDLATVGTVWYRRPRPPVLDEFRLRPDATAFARDEWRAALEGALTLLNDPLWVSHPDRLREGARKPRQLLIARALGLAIPCTLITNDPQQARTFIERLQGRVIVKPTGAGWISEAETDRVRYVLTNRLAPDDLAHLDDIAIAPITLQEEISKAYELRVTIVGREVLAIRIDSQRSPLSQVDWRRYDVTRTPYTAYPLPVALQWRLLRLTQVLGLEYGAIDLIREPDGRYVFLEINGSGQFLWAEELSGVGVSDALARLLAGRAEPLATWQGRKEGQDVGIAEAVGQGGDPGAYGRSSQPRGGRRAGGD